MKRALQNALDAGALGASRVEGVECAGALSRIGILDATSAASEQSAQRLVDALGKSIGGFLALDIAEGEKVIYLAKSSDDFRVTPPSAREPSHDL